MHSSLFIFGTFQKRSSCPVRILPFSDSVSVTVREKSNLGIEAVGIDTKAFWKDVLGEYAPFSFVIFESLRSIRILEEFWRISNCLTSIAGKELVFGLFEELKRRQSNIYTIYKHGHNSFILLQFSTAIITAIILKYPNHFIIIIII